MDAEAIAAAEEGDFARAAELFEQHIQAHPQDAAAMEMHAQCLLSLERYDEAVASAQQSIQLAPNVGSSHHTLARCLRESGYLWGALSAIIQAVTSDDVSQPDELLHEAEEIMSLTARDLAQRVGLPDLAAFRFLRMQREGDATRTELGTATQTWDSAVALAHWFSASSKGELTSSCCGSAVASFPHAVHVRHLGAPCLELGCGTGLAGTAAALVGYRVVLTDTETVINNSIVGDNCRELSDVIAEHNGAARAAVLDWKCPERHFAELEIEPALVFGADLIFHRDSIAPLIATLKHLQSTCYGGMGFLMVHKSRHELDDELAAALAELGIHSWERSAENKRLYFVSGMLTTPWRL